MAKTNNDEFLTTAQVAQWIGIPPSTLAWMRSLPDGPVYTRVSARNVRYRRRDIEAWVNDRRSVSR